MKKCKGAPAFNKIMKESKTAVKQCNSYFRMLKLEKVRVKFGSTYMWVDMNSMRLSIILVAIEGNIDKIIMPADKEKIKKRLMAEKLLNG